MPAARDGDIVAIQSYKHNGQIHRTWQHNTILKYVGNILITANHYTLVTEGNGHYWKTADPTIAFFHKKYWFNIVIQLKKEGVSYYCNLASPFLIDEEAIKYIDYDLDIKVFPDGHTKLLDKREYQRHREKMGYPDEIDAILKANIAILQDWIANKKGPFSEDFVRIWRKRQELLLHAQKRYKKRKK